MNYLPMEFLFINLRILIVAIVDVLVISFYWRPIWDKGKYDAAAFVKYQVLLFGAGAIMSLIWDWLLYLPFWLSLVTLVVIAWMVVCATEDLLYGLFSSTVGLNAKSFPAPAQKEPNYFVFVRFIFWKLPDQWKWLGRHESRPTNKVLIWFAGEKVCLYPDTAEGSAIGLLGAVALAETICYLATVLYP